MVIPFFYFAFFAVDFSVFFSVASSSFVLLFFAFATVLGWGLYGARCAQYLFGSGVLSVGLWRGRWKKSL